jgi:hypothetical protein
MLQPPSKGRWYPTKSQLKDPDALERTLRQVLTQHYNLVDQVGGMREQMSQPARGKQGPPPGSGPMDSMLLGLPVAPTDLSKLADGTKLTYDKKNGIFRFS